MNSAEVDTALNTNTTVLACKIHCAVMLVHEMTCHSPHYNSHESICSDHHEHLYYWHHLTEYLSRIPSHYPCPLLLNKFRYYDHGFRIGMFPCPRFLIKTAGYYRRSKSVFRFSPLFLLIFLPFPYESS